MWEINNLYIFWPTSFIYFLFVLPLQSMANNSSTYYLGTYVFKNYQNSTLTLNLSVKMTILTTRLLLHSLLFLLVKLMRQSIARPGKRK